MSTIYDVACKIFPFGLTVLSAEERKICEDIAGQEWGNMWIGKAEIPQELAELTEVNTNN